MARTDKASLLIHADPSVVFGALTDRVALETWLPPTGMHGNFEHFDMRSGGSYRLVLSYDDPSGSPGKSSADTDVAEVRIIALDQDVRVVQEVDFDSEDPAFAGTMEMEWRLLPDGDGTIVEIIARNVPEGVRARDHAEGIASSLVNLAAYLEP